MAMHVTEIRHGFQEIFNLDLLENRIYQQMPINGCYEQASHLKERNLQSCLLLAMRRVLSKTALASEFDILC